jgi:hypothetical protein
MAKRTSPGTLLAWLHEAIDRDTEECIIWPFGIRSNGYGSVRFDGRSRGAHQVAWVLAGRAPVERPREIRHRCGVRACVNPRHLVEGSRTENMGDARAHGTLASGARHGRSKLTADEVREIRASAEPRRVLSARFGIHVEHVTRLRSGRSWQKL